VNLESRSQVITAIETRITATGTRTSRSSRYRYLPGAKTRSTSFGNTKRC